MRPRKRETRLDVVKFYVVLGVGGGYIPVRQCEQEKTHYRQGAEPERKSAEIICIRHSHAPYPGKFNVLLHYRLPHEFYRMNS